MPAQLQEEMQLLEKRMAKLERLVQNLYEKLEVAAPEGGAGGGWWGGSDEDGGSESGDSDVARSPTSR